MTDFEKLAKTGIKFDPYNTSNRRATNERIQREREFLEEQANQPPEPGVFSNITSGVARGAKAGLGGILGGLGHAAKAETGYGGDFAQSMEDLSSANAKQKNYTWQDVIPFMSDYYTGRDGAAYDIGQAVGSMAVPMALGAGTAATLGTGGAALPVVGAGLGGLVMAASEGGNTYKEALDKGYSEDEARSAGRRDAMIKAPFYMLSEGLTGAAGKALLSRAGKEAVKEGLGRTILKKGGTLLGEGINEGLEEVFDNKSSNYALNRDPNKSLAGDVLGGTVNPYSWNDEDQEAFRSAFMGSLLTGGIGAGAAKAYHTAVGENTETKAKPKPTREKVETPAQAEEVFDTAEKIDERLQEIDAKIETAAINGNTGELTRLGKERQELVEAKENILPEDTESLEKLQSKVDSEIEQVSQEIENAVVNLGEAKDKRKAAEKLQSLYEKRGKLAERSEQIANKIEMVRTSRPTNAPQQSNTPGVNYGNNFAERMQVAEAVDTGRAQRVDPQDVANGIGRAQGADYGNLMGEEPTPQQPWQGYNSQPKTQQVQQPAGPSYAEQQRQKAEQNQRDTGWYQMETEYAQRKASERAQQKGFSGNIGEWQAATMQPSESALVQDYTNAKGETLRISKNDKNGLLKVSKGNDETYFTSLGEAEEFVKTGKSPYDNLGARERSEKATEIRAAMAGKDAVNRALERLKEKYAKAKTVQEVNQITGEAISDPNRILRESDIGKAMVGAKKRIKEELKTKAEKQAREKGFAANLGDWHAVYDEKAPDNVQDYENDKGEKIKIVVDEGGPVNVLKSKGGSYWFTHLADANEFVKTGKNPYDKLTKEERLEKEAEIRAGLVGKEAVEKALAELKEKYAKAKNPKDIAEITAKAWRDPNRILKISQIGELQKEAKNRIVEERKRREEEERKRREEEERKRKEEQEAIIKDFSSKIDGFINAFLDSVKAGDATVDVNKKLKSYKGKAVALHTKIKKDGKLTEEQLSKIRTEYMDKFAEAKDKALNKANSGAKAPTTQNAKAPTTQNNLVFEAQEFATKFGVKNGLVRIGKDTKVNMAKLSKEGAAEKEIKGVGNVLVLNDMAVVSEKGSETLSPTRLLPGSRVVDAQKYFEVLQNKLDSNSLRKLGLIPYATLATDGVTEEYVYFEDIVGGGKYKADSESVKFLLNKFGDDVDFAWTGINGEPCIAACAYSRVMGFVKAEPVGQKGPTLQAIKDIGKPDRITIGRSGKDYRNGKNVKVADVLSKFALYDVSIGGRLNPEEKQALVNKLYDALSDLADILGVDPTALSLGGTLHITVNANLGDGTHGSATRVHSLYERHDLKLSSHDLEHGGSLAHEWLHCLDNYLDLLADPVLEPIPMLSEIGATEELARKKSREAIEKVAQSVVTAQNLKLRPEVVAAFAEVRRTIESVTGVGKRSKALARSWGWDYIKRVREMYARTFNVYISQKLKARGEVSNYLAATPSEEYMKKNHGYPTDMFPDVKPSEYGDIVKAYDNLFATLLTKETKGYNGRMVQTFYSASEERQLVRSFADVVEELVKANPGAGFSVNLDGDIIMEQKDGSKTKVNIVDNILLNESEMQNAKASHGLSGNVIINGMWQKATEPGFNSVLTLSRRSERGTAFHEALHAAMDNALTAKEKDALYKYYSNQAEKLGMDVEEVIADAYRDWVLSRQNGQGTMFGKLWRKVKDFCNRMLSAFSKSAEANRIFQDIESGKVRERGNVNENINKAETNKNQNSKSEQGKVSEQGSLKGKEEKVPKVNYSAQDATKTPRFKEWFGNSKLVDEDGKPIVLYRGIEEKYDVGKQGEVTWVTPNKEQADSYRNGTAGSELLEVYARVEKPLYLGDSWTEHSVSSLVKNKLLPALNKAFQNKQLTREQGLKLRNKLNEMIKNDNGEMVLLFELYNDNPDVLSVIKGMGYDAIEVEEGGNRTYGVIGKSNVKSATDNNGNFSRDNDDIHYSVGQEEINRAYDEVLEEGKQAFPNGKFERDKNNNLIVTLPNGDKFQYSIKDNIILNAKDQKKAMESHGTSSGVVQGYWKKFTQNGVNRILAVSKNSERGTAFHEAMHAAIDLALTKRERDALYKYYEKVAQQQNRDVEEVVADAYRDWVLARKDNQGTMFGKLWRKVKDFCTRVKGLFDKGAEVQSIFQDVESGSVYERGTRNNNKGNVKFDVVKARDNLKRDIAEWGKRVDEYLAQTIDASKPVTVMQTPLVMQYVGAKDLPIKMDTSIMGKSLQGRHGGDLTPDILKQLPGAMANPMFIYKSHDNGGAKTLGVVLSLRDANKDFILAAVVMEVSEDGRSYDIHKVASVYGKKAFRRQNALWPTNVIGTNTNPYENLLYIDKKRIDSWSKSTGLQLPQGLDYKNNSFPSIIATNDDLVNLREVYPEKYSVREDTNETPEARGARAVSRSKAPTVRERLESVRDSFYKDWVDKLDPLNKLQAEIENAIGQKLDYDRNVYKQARMAESTARGRAEMLVMGEDAEATVEAINKTMKGKKLEHAVTLRSVFDLIKDADMSNSYPDYLDNGGFENWQHAFSTYLTARRQLELQNKNPDYVGPMDNQDARAIVNNAPSELAEAAEKYYQYNDNMLTIAEDAGLISEEVHEALNDKYSDYAPMMRDFSDTAGVDSFFGGLGGSGIGNVSNFLKKISKDGSSRNVIDPLETTVKNTYMILNRAERNKVAQLFVDLSHENGIGEFIEPVDRETSDPKNSIFTVMVDGKKQAFKTMPEFYSAIAGCNEQGAGAIGSLVRSAAQCLRTGATISPDFIFRNLVRDTIFAGISSKTGFRPLIDTIKGMQALRHNKELAEEFKAAGVPMSNFVGTNRRGAAETLNKLTGGDKKFHKLDPRRIISALYEMAQDYSELIEEGTRMGEFMRAREQGLSIEEAGFLAKEITLDFSRSGTYGQKYNQAVPFFNACIQGGDKFVRLMKQEPRATFMGVTKYIILPSLALWCMNHDEDWYKDLPEDVKNGSWCIKTGDTIWRIPKPQEAGVLFGSGMERFLDMVNDENPKAMKNWAREYFLGTCMPNFIPTLVLPMIEWTTNYSFFTGKEVVGTKYKRLPEEQQYSLYTTELAKRVGSVTGTSPMKIDNTIKGYFGTAGSFVATSMDNIFGKEYESPEKRWSEYAGIRGITYQEGRRSQAVSDFYELVDEANKQHEGYGKKGKPAGYVVGLRQANKKISDLNKDIRTVTVARNLTPEQKRAKIDKMQLQIRNIAKLALARYKDKVNS